MGCRSCGRLAAVRILLGTYLAFEHCSQNFLKLKYKLIRVCFFCNKSVKQHKSFWYKWNPGRLAEERQLRPSQACGVGRLGCGDGSPAVMWASTAHTHSASGEMHSAPRADWVSLCSSVLSQHTDKNLPLSQSRLEARSGSERKWRASRKDNGEGAYGGTQTHSLVVRTPIRSFWVFCPLPGRSTLLLARLTMLGLRGWVPCQ